MSRVNENAGGNRYIVLDDLKENQNINQELLNKINPRVDKLIEKIEQGQEKVSDNLHLFSMQKHCFRSINPTTNLRKKKKLEQNKVHAIKQKQNQQNVLKKKKMLEQEKIAKD